MLESTVTTGNDWLVPECIERLMDIAHKYPQAEMCIRDRYEVVGYFDIKPNDALSSQCSYLGNPDGFSDFMSAHPGITVSYTHLDVYKRQVDELITKYCK